MDALERDIEQSRQEENRLGSEITLQESRIESLRQETAALDVRILEVQKQYAASLQERVGLEKRKAQLDEQRRRLMESGSDEDRRQQLQALVQDARMEYEDRLTGSTGWRNSGTRRKQTCWRCRKNRNAGCRKLPASGTGCRICRDGRIRYRL